MTVYFATTRIDPSTVKIGFTSDLEARKKNLSVSVPGGVTILCSMEGGLETEQFLHEKFAHLNVSGEWFDYSDELREFVTDVINKKPCLIPFVDDAAYMTRETAEYGRDAVELARQMAEALLNKEFRGVGDTIDAAMFRLEQKTGLPGKLLHRLRYRARKDIWAGEYLHIKSVYEARFLTVENARQKDREAFPTRIEKGER